MSSTTAQAPRRPRLFAPLTLASLLPAWALLAPAEARACGCFAPPDPSVPVLQAGERIVFSHEDGVVTAHIQIQYQGAASEFAWLLPLPTEPTLQLGVEELFTRLITTTQPKYRLTQIVGDSCAWGARARSPSAAEDASIPPQAGNSDGVVVVQATIGPYDYAVLHADSKSEMFQWLTDNHYFVPVGTEDVVGPYIHPGAYFLALKLRKGNDVGDLQPVVVRYASDLPMIPIILTSVAANPNMGVQVWILGKNRAIPRNYRHAVLNEELIDWFNAGANYNDVVIKAIDEAEGGHAFVTEYAGTTDVMKDLLDSAGRFGERSTLQATTDAGAYVRELQSRGFPWSSTLISALKSTFPFPARLAATGVPEDQYYQQLAYYLGFDRTARPELYAEETFDFDPVALTATLWERIVEPTLAAGKLFRDSPKMTRLYTTLSPEEMNMDPVFSFNPDLPDQSNVHEATLEYICDLNQDGPQNTPATLRLEDGRAFHLSSPSAWRTRDTSNIAYATRIELLREEGAPEVEIDNVTRISPGERARLSGCGCSSTSNDEPWGTISMGILLAIGLVIRLRSSNRE